MRRWSLLAALLGVFLLTWWLGCSNPNLAGGKLHFDQADRLEDPAERTARFQRALDTFKKAVQEMPANPEARHWLGRAFAELDMPDSARANFDRAVELDAVVEPEVMETREHYYSRNYNSGLTSADKAIKARASGDQAVAEEAFNEAFEYFRIAAIYRPDHVQAVTMMGKVQLNLGDVDRALELLREARSLAPNEEAVQRDLFLVYREEGDKAYQDAALAIQSGDSTKARDQFQVARDLYDEADKVMPGDPDLNFQLGAAAYELAQLDPGRRSELLDEAITRYREVLRDNPVDVDVLYNLALVLRDLERFEEAKEIAARLVDLRPRDGTYRDVLGRIEGSLGDRQAQLNGVVFGRALKTGTTEDVGTAAALSEQWGVGSDIKKRYLENGPPEEILTFTDPMGEQYYLWFYWSRGLAYGFVGGKQNFMSKFAPTGVIEVDKAEITTQGVSKYLTGIVSNGGPRDYEYVKILFDLYDENEELVAHNLPAVTESLESRGVWNFEIPLNGESEEAAVRAEVADILSY